MKKLYPYLLYAGALPFLICTVCLMLNINTIPYFGDTSHILIVYALVIISFMAGSHWGQHLPLENRWRVVLPVLSNLIAIIVWVGFVVLPTPVLLTLFAITYLILLLIDQQLLRDEIIGADYFFHRCIITVIVILSLVTAGMSL